jgi:Domain of unknown function (DUF4263)
MKTLETFSISLAQCKKDLDQFKKLLDGKSSLSERDVIQYVGLLVIGRRHYLDNRQSERMRWRSEQVLVGSRQVNCITFDELYQTLALKVTLFG